jgi:hypothetical protein
MSDSHSPFVVRTKAALAKLPADERAAFTQLWADVAALLKKAQAKPKQPPSAAGSSRRWLVLDLTMNPAAAGSTGNCGTNARCLEPKSNGEWRANRDSGKRVR